MRFLNLFDDEQRRPAGGDNGTPAGAELERARSDSERLLAAGDEAIRRALGANSQAFLQASQQQGGQ